MIESAKKADSGDSAWRLGQDGEIEINEAIASDASISAFAEVGLSLPEGFAEEASRNAGLLERRLSRLESLLGLGPIS